MVTEDKSKPLPIPINISPEILEMALAQSIINTSLGDKIKDAMDKSINSTSSNGRFGYRSLIQQGVDEYVVSIVREEAIKLIEPKREEIRQKIAEQLSDVAIDNVITKLFESFNRNF